MAERAESGEFGVRRWHDGDLPHIMSSWLHSYHNGAAVRGLRHKIYYHYQRKLIQQLLKRAYVLVVYDKKDPKEIAAWLCAERYDSALVIHYVHVKERLRGLGVAKRLIEEIVETEQPAAVMYTHKTFFVADYRKKCEQEGRNFPLQTWIYNSFLPFHALEEGWYK